MLDIHAAHKADQQRAGDEGLAEAVKRSTEAKRGLAPRGDVSLPRELITAVDAVVEATGEDRTIIRDNALELWNRLKRTSAVGPPPSSARDRQSLAVHYDLPTSVGYLAGLMPSVYAATLNALSVTRDRLSLMSEGRGEPAWEPDRLIDFGSGTGSAAWAFEEVWGVQTKAGVPREYVGLEASINMVELSSGLFGALPLRRTDSLDLPGPATSAKLNAKAYQLALPASSSSLAKLQIHPKSMQTKRTVALAAFTLGDLTSREKRKDLVRAMWDSGAEVIVVVDRGTPAGSRMVIEAREQLLMYGRREVARARGAFEVEVDQELLDAGFEIVPDGVEEDVEVDPSLGSFVVAPCPHDGACPLHNSTKAFCHFSQRVQNPAFLRHTKHTTRGQDDAKFSYVVVRRGQRPLPASPVEHEADTAASADGAVVVHDRSMREPEAPLDVGEELARPRIVAPPMKRSGHVILEVCSPTGDIERHTIPKSQGRQAYYDARKAAWGDAFPHAPKNGPQPSPSTAPSAYDDPLTDDLTGKPKNKFGGDPKQRGKKAEREHGKREARALREQGRKDRSAKRAARKGGDDGFGGFRPDSHGVVDVDLEMGADGQLRVR
ncbi:37S ribosomal protein S22 [Rhodosporidiobolus nylandii]